MLQTHPRQFQRTQTWYVTDMLVVLVNLHFETETSYGLKLKYSQTTTSE